LPSAVTGLKGGKFRGVGGDEAEPRHDNNPSFCWKPSGHSSLF
jgi:hypothetical protein